MDAERKARAVIRAAVEHLFCKKCDEPRVAHIKQVDKTGTRWKCPNTPGFYESWVQWDG